MTSLSETKVYYTQRTGHPFPDSIHIGERTYGPGQIELACLDLLMLLLHRIKELEDKIDGL